MSEFRRGLMMGQKEEVSSWYRLCPDGIYTTTGAYINTLFKNFSNNNFEYYVDCKLLETSTTTKLVTGSCRNYSSTCYNIFSFVGTSVSGIRAGLYMFCRWVNSESYVSNVRQLAPFQGKRIRGYQAKNRTNQRSYIQEYVNGVYGEKHYYGYEDGTSNSTSCPYPMLLFRFNLNGSPSSDTGDNISIYETQAKYNDNIVYWFKACQLTQNITADLAWDNQPHSAGEYGMYNEVDGKFYGNANSTGYFLENFD